MIVHFCTKTLFFFFLFFFFINNWILDYFCRLQVRLTQHGENKTPKCVYVEWENRACFDVNKTQFRQTTCLDTEDQVYKIEASKLWTERDLPIQLGHFKQLYVKLRMLPFYYDFLDTYVDHSNF